MEIKARSFLVGLFLSMKQKSTYLLGFAWEFILSLPKDALVRFVRFATGLIPTFSVWRRSPTHKHCLSAKLIKNVSLNNEVYAQIPSPRGEEKEG